MKILKALPVLIIVLFWSCSNKTEEMEKELKNFIGKHELQVRPLIKQTNLAYWTASLSGKNEDYEKAQELQIQLVKIYSDKNDFETLKRIKESNAVKDSLLARQLKGLYNAYLKSMVDTQLLNEIVRMETEVEQKYSKFRAQVGKKECSDNDIEEILQQSKDNNELREAWMAHKKIGSLVADDIRNLVHKRNEMAHSIGFKNYQEMSLTLNEQNPDQIEKLFDELDSLTLESFKSVKNDIDDFLSKRLKIKKEELMPWHYQNRFFQEAPSIYKTDFDVYYKNIKLEEITKNYYTSIGLDITDILAHSDLYEKPGKNQHAYCIDIDNEGDVRVLCNLKSNAKWMNTMLHEYGHAVYDKYIDPSLPYFLREPAHIFTTEAIAMMFGRMASNPQWMMDMGLIDQKEKTQIENDCFANLRMEQLVFSRWAQVMYRFEKSMYANPDQDLNKLWWDLVERFQFIKKPEGRDEPDWATKIHIATSPCYYHNYLLGELLASQLHYYIADSILKTTDLKNQSYMNHPEVGQFLQQKVFYPGSKYEWDEMIQKATGEHLTANYYAKQFIR